MPSIYDALTRIARSTDFEAVRAFELFSTSLSEAAMTKREEILSGIPDDLRSVDGRDVLADLNANASVRLPETTSVLLARELFVAAAQSEKLAPLVVKSFEDWPDDKQMVETILAIGLVGAVWMVLASTRVDLRIGHLELKKDTNTAEQLRAFAEVIRALRSPKL